MREGPELAGVEFREVEPMGGAAPYLGGKRNLARRLVSRIEKIPHVCYAEPFVGMGGVFFGRRLAPRLEVINDRCRDVSNFFRVLQRHYQVFIDMMRWQLTTRVEFERLVATDPDTLTDLERAARFYYLQRCGFGGKIRGRTFGVELAHPARFDITRLAPHLEELHCRLSGVVIECLPYQEFIRRYDRASTLFYLDPPYRGSESSYGADLFCSDDFQRLAELLQTLKGRFIMTVNDDIFLRQCFAKYSLSQVETTYMAGGGHRTKRVCELIISGP